MDSLTRRTWAEISLSNLEHNYRLLRDLLPAGCRYLSLIKANAYGHGMVPVAKKMEALGADYFAVACLDEALEVRRAGIRTPVLILGVTLPEDAEEVVRCGATQSVSDRDGALALSAAAQKLGLPARVHIKLDTGMSRVGFPAREECAEETARAVLEVCALPGIDAEGIFTHFAAADDPAREPYTMMQFQRFLDMLDRLEKLGRTFPIRHCAASSATLNYPCTYLDMVRPGIAQFGHYPAAGMEGLAGGELKPVMSVKSRVVLVKDLPAGTCVSYGCTCTLTRDSRVATVPIGYGDGFFRLLSNRGEMLVSGRRAKILGRICMDMCMIDVTDIPGVKPGDVATVFGPGLPLEEKADAAGTIQYEMLCDISPRVPRIYLE